MIHVNSGRFGAVRSKSLHPRTAFAPRAQTPVNNIDQGTDQIAFTSRAHSANGTQASAATYHVKERMFPRLTPLPKEMEDEINRLREVNTPVNDIAEIMNKTLQHPYDMTKKKVNDYVKWGDTCTEEYLPSNKAIPPVMLEEINRLHDNKLDACKITTVICANLQHPYAIRLSRIRSYLQRRDLSNRPMLDSNTPIPADMQTEIHRLVKLVVSPKSIARKMLADPTHRFGISDSRIRKYLLGEPLLPSNVPIPESMLQEIDRLFEPGKKATAIATIMNKDPKHPYKIPQSRIDLYLTRKVDGHRALPSDEAIPESMRQEIDRLVKSGKRARAIARIMNENPEHPYAIFAPRIQTYQEQKGILKLASWHNQSLPENFIFPRRHPNARTLRSAAPVVHRAENISHAEAAKDVLHESEQRNLQEFDDIDLDVVLDELVGNETAQFNLGASGVVVAG